MRSPFAREKRTDYVPSAFRRKTRRRIFRLKPEATGIALLLALVAAPAFAQPETERPFGTLREQAEMQQAWLKKRLDTYLPALMRRHGIDMWVVPMREYNEDPVFSALTAPETFAAR